MLRFPSLEKLGLSAAAITGRADDNCALGGGPETLSRRAGILRELGLEPERIVAPRQTHSDITSQVNLADAGRGFNGPETAIPNTDGLMTDVPGLALTITVADCVPVFLFDPKRKAVALVHAGREGTVKHITERAVARLIEAYGVVAGDIHAVIGPSAGPCCYEVSEEMAVECAKTGIPVQGRMLDLWEGNARQLIQMGVPRDQIDIASVCTLCGEAFFSYRGGDLKSRNMAVLAI